MAATKQDVEELKVQLAERVAEVTAHADTLIDLGAEHLTKTHEEIKHEFGVMRARFGDKLLEPGQTVQAAIETSHNQMVEKVTACEQEIIKLRQELQQDQRRGGSHRWDIKDPKARGTVKFAGNQKDDVKVFTQWRKHAVIYLEKFIPGLGKFLEELVVQKKIDEYTIPNMVAKYDFEMNFDELEDALHYFLFEHLTDAAADLVESCGTDGFAMWRAINGYYEPSSHATHANIHAAVYEMSRRKAKTAAEMHGLLREFEKRLQKLTQVGGTISDIAKASIIYNMMDDVTQKTICDAGKNDDFDFMRLKIIREGSESREKAILKHSKAVPMELDALGQADEAGADGGDLNVVINPNITCFICKEKGHIARQCPHNDGKGGDARTPGANPYAGNRGKGGDGWWYGGKPDKGKSGGQRRR